MFQFSSEQFRVKVGLAEMLKGGVIMDVTNAEQAKIAEDAGASAVMALERVPADIRKEGGVARMANISIMEAIMRTVTIPVMAKALSLIHILLQTLATEGEDYSGGVSTAVLGITCPSPPMLYARISTTQRGPASACWMPPRRSRPRN